MESQQSLAFSYRLGKATISKILKETCDVIYDVLALTCLPPSSVDDWLNIAMDFENTWDLPHVLGELDEKHVRIQCAHQKLLLCTIITKAFLVWTYLQRAMRSISLP